MKANIAFEIDTEMLGGYTDNYIAALWHIAQANPADPMQDRNAGQLAEIIGRDIIRRFLAATAPELWHHQGGHADWAKLHLISPAITEAGSISGQHELTYEERLLLKALAAGPQDDRDCIPERVLVNTGLAERFGIGQIQITAAGRSAHAKLA
jgi:hypothetical protein